MKAKVTKWGNSLGLRLPKALSLELGIEEGGIVDMQILQGKLVIQSVPPNDSLEDLVSRITPDNRHSEADWGEPIGAEYS